MTAAPEVTAETTGATAPTGDTVSSTTPTPPPPPKQPEIVLDGLPEAPADLAYVIVIEAGASDYSASPVAREEFPQLDATTRGTVSIGRRLQDPLAELVKIDPQHIGVGLYQHDVKAKHLKESLEAVIESCVNTVGVDLNTASVPLLRHVSGMNQLVAREVVTHRERNGPFTSREQLMTIPGLGEKRYTQAAGFLKIPDAPDPLDKTWIHPESYPLARQILTDLGFAPADLDDKEKLAALREQIKTVNPEEAARVLNAGVPTVADILDALAKPGRDPREDVPPPIFKKGVLKLEDISPGMELRGTVLNVVPFGAFVDIGLKESGLVHISQMANRYIKSPYDVVAVGDVVTVWVIEVKPGEKKISLSMIQPGQERRPPEPRGRFDGPPQQQREPRPPRQDAPPRPQQQGDRPAFENRGQGGPGGPGGQRRFGGPGQGGGRGPGGPGQRGGFVPRPGGPAPGQGQPPRQPEGGTPPGQQPPRPQPAQPPRPPSKPKPLPKLTAEKKAGKAPLNTFAELMAMFSPEPPPPPPEPPKPVEKPPEPKAEEKPAEQPPAPPPADAPPPEPPPAT
ncbi:MAG TPA: helix-hairpin-helix domain-containing protein [Gemmataceae bacterium]|nr:helix-hairpin-helix domain-containing protein [Gemmataceae bacterium]